MKEFIMIWNRFAGRRYSSVSRGNNQSDSSDLEESTSPATQTDLRRKSSVVVNQFYNGVPVDTDDRPRWPRSIFMPTTLGLVSLAFGCFILLCQPYDLLFRWKVVFGEGGEIFEIWRKPQVTLYLKVYLFNVTNHEAYLSGKEPRLRFQEIGPYVYREGLEHSNVKFNDNGTVTANPLHPLTYVPELSNGTEEDIMILPNIALLSITNVMRNSAYLSRWGLNMLIRQSDSHPLVPMTAREFMFGYQSTLVTLGNNLMPSWIKFGKLGLIDRMYDFEGDVETVYTGETDLHKTGLIEKYNHDYNLPQWTGKCANVNGASDGAKFPSYIGPNDTLLFFRKSLCRSATMVRTGEATRNGLHTYEYKFRENELDNGAVNPENKCFCRKGRCLKAGLIDVTDCYYGFPIALSYPHFYKADPSILSAIEGLKPVPELHESIFYIQPQSGLPVHLAFRFQINMALQNIAHMSRVEMFENMTLPLLWFEISLPELTPSLMLRFWLYLNVLPILQEFATYAFFSMSIGFLLWGIYRMLLYQSKQATTGGRQWFDIEMQKKNLRFMNDRQSMSKGMDKLYSNLLTEKEPIAMTELTKN